MSPTPQMRPAGLDDLEALTELCLRSKAHWGYDAAFIAACRDDLTLHPADLTRGEVWMRDGPVAVVQILPGDPAGEIRHLFLDPSLIGQGVGRVIWDFACTRARAMGCSKVTLSSEPKAAGFYEAMGGRHIGFEHSTIFPGRKLPRYEIDL
ncbi:MAG: GNAT family N-acetyltransferase [Pseudomonadota bacterium]